MATRKSTRGLKRRRNSMSVEEKIWQQFEKQPAVITEAVIDEIEHVFGRNQPFGPWRRTALVSLARPRSQLIESCKERKGAETFAYARMGIADYAKRLRDLADLMDKADMRLMLAVCVHDDATEISREAEAKWKAGPSEDDRQRDEETLALMEKYKLAGQRPDTREILRQCQARGFTLKKTVAEMRKPRKVTT